MTLKIILILALLLLSAFFSATETAFSSLNKTRLKSLAEHGNRKADRALKLAEDYDDLLSTILVGNNIVNIAMASVGTLLFTDILKGNADTGATVSTAVITLLVLIFGEVTPKSLAKESPEKFAMRVTPLVSVLVKILTPVNWLFSKWKAFLGHFFKNKEDRRLTQDELITMVEEVEQEGVLDKEESELVRSAIEFRDQDVADILTPRVRIDGVSLDETTEEVENVFLKTGYSRLPVYRETLDDIVGVIHQKDFYRALKQNRVVKLAEIMKEPVYVPESTGIDDLLRQMQKEKVQLAVVTDEYGGTAGIVTMEDILEELVGEIWDEHDEIEESFKKITDTSWQIRGDADAEDFAERFSLTIETEAATVGGWVMEHEERVPDPGDSFLFGGWRISVLEADERHVLLLGMEKAAAEEEEASGREE
ncbi:MAG: HlyC/CorC family transporter [Clostridiales bacterium]|nr:HlyC/CorC family transporter [Clostridiales bacterium]